MFAGTPFRARTLAPAAEASSTGSHPPDSSTTGDVDEGDPIVATQDASAVPPSGARDDCNGNDDDDGDNDEDDNEDEDEEDSVDPLAEGKVERDAFAVDSPISPRSSGMTSGSSAG